MGMFACSISGVTVIFHYCCSICCIVDFDRARRGLVFEKALWTSGVFISFLWTRWNNQMLALKSEFPLRDWDARHVKVFSI